MSRVLKVLSLLLTYPTEQLKAEAGELRAALAQDPSVKPSARNVLTPLFDSLERDELLDLQCRYVDLFDRTRSLSLHLFEHVHGESRERGQAMIDLRETYLERGFHMTPEELPDYLPAFLEFASLLPEHEARQLLRQPAHVIQALHERLVKRGAIYASVFEALLELARTRPSAEALEILRRQPDASADDFEAVDAAWEEAPVRFGPESPAPTGFVAKMRAWKRPAEPAGRRAD